MWGKARYSIRPDLITDKAYRTVPAGLTYTFIIVKA